MRKVTGGWCETEEDEMEEVKQLCKQELKQIDLADFVEEADSDDERAEGETIPSEHVPLKADH